MIPKIRTRIPALRVRADHSAALHGLGSTLVQSTRVGTCDGRSITTFFPLKDFHRLFEPQPTIRLFSNCHAVSTISRRFGYLGCHPRVRFSLSEFATSTGASPSRRG